MQEALGGSGNVDHVVMTPTGVWVVETEAHWLSPRRFPAALGQAANNARRVRRHLKTPLPVPERQWDLNPPDLGAQHTLTNASDDMPAQSEKGCAAGGD